MKSSNVKVWNRNKFDYVEKFKGSEIFIPALKSIEMDYDEAKQFIGTFRTPVRRKGGNQDPASFKWLEIDKEDRARIMNDRANAIDSDDKEVRFLCHVCGKEFLTKNGLLKHIKEKHMDVMVDKDAKKELLDNEDI